MWARAAERQIEPQNSEPRLRKSIGTLIVQVDYFRVRRNPAEPELRRDPSRQLRAFWLRMPDVTFRTTKFIS
jgi:hypothetical protein